MKTAAQAAQNWQQSAGRAGTAWQQGVQSYTGDWAGSTTAQQSALVSNWNQAVSSGRWASGVQRVGTNGWKTKTEAKAANYATGFAAGAGAQQAAITKIMAALGNIVPSLPPRGTYEQNKTRATALMDNLHALRGTLGA